MSSEQFMFMENGCQHYDDCFTCPFPDCVLGNQIQARKWVGIYRDRQALAKVEFDNPTSEVAAERLGVTVRTYYRIKERVNAAG